MKAVAVWVLAGTLAAGTPHASAQASLCNESTSEVAVEKASAPRPDQTIYKGVVGNLLEALPLDPKKLVEMQRANAVVSNPLSARSLALLLGVANPIVMLGGLVWGLFAASRIEGPSADLEKVKAKSDAARRNLPVEAGD